MRAMLLCQPGQPLRAGLLPVPAVGAGQLLLRVGACGVCRTDLHILDGELAPHRLPLVPGHEIAGTVVAVGSGCGDWGVGARAGVPWLAATCGACPACRRGQENLCDKARFTGYDVHGGYAEYALADAAFAVRLPPGYDDAHAAPLLCAGLIGYRAYAMAGTAERIGLYGFGAAAHLLAQVALAQGRSVYAFTRPGDLRSQQFARELGVAWTGGSDQAAPVVLDAALLFAPAGALVPAALRAVRKGGSVICAGIHMSDIPSFPYALLWGERCVRSVANLTRADAAAFMALAECIALAVHVTPYPLAQANEALAALRAGSIDGAAVLVP
ncbi:zinc-dependent alcohol dehydrogenase family protein [[Empedobacter] haloabium]|uniref:Zinc-dependent alcohol dehydrogenase family protein n=1 Tax=[Empedobacter] haloabium TaxID=592317 RepID=A0ABZ1UXK6_9BURK